MLTTTPPGTALARAVRFFRSEAFLARTVSAEASWRDTSSLRVISVSTPMNRASSSTRRLTARLIWASTVPSAAIAPPSMPPWPGSMTSTGPCSRTRFLDALTALPCQRIAANPAKSRSSVSRYSAVHFLNVKNMLPPPSTLCRRAVKYVWDGPAAAPHTARAHKMNGGRAPRPDFP